MSEERKQRWNHRRVYKFVRCMGILYACHVLVQIASHYYIRALAPDRQFDGGQYILLCLVYAGLFLAWHKHALFVACGLGAVLCLLLAYQSVIVGLSADALLWKLTCFAVAPAVLGVFGWMFVWYPVKLIRRVA